MEQENRYASQCVLSGNNGPYVLDMYEQYCQNPHSVDPSWQSFFQKYPKHYVSEKAPHWSKKNTEQNLQSAPDHSVLEKSMAAMRLMQAYRSLGHLACKLDPLGLSAPHEHPELTIEFYGLKATDLPYPVYLGKLFQEETISLEKLLIRLRSMYCGTVGIEYFHIHNPNQRAWLQKRFEEGISSLSIPKQEALYKNLVQAEKFEKILHTKFQGAKRFGLDGGECLIPALEMVLEKAAHHKMLEIQIGMAHRGRLSVLTHIMGKPTHLIMAQFQGTSIYRNFNGSGDVKYHQGYSSDRIFDGHNLHLSLVPNPSHLEAVYPVVLGKVRGEQSSLNDTLRKQVMGVLIHGDAAFIGQGVVAESLQLAKLDGYTTGGTLHFIINNQVGFTANPTEGKSSTHCSDVAKAIQAPIFHVNGDDPEAVIWVTELAMDYRQKFGHDVVIDLVCYRRYGHNESDEPTFTQPKMYEIIKNHPPISEIYKKKLLAQGTLTAHHMNTIVEQVDKNLISAFEQAENLKNNIDSTIEPDWLKSHWAGIQAKCGPLPLTGVAQEKLVDLGLKTLCVPEGFHLNPKIQRLLAQRKNMLKEETAIDWGMAESLAFATLLDEGFPIRLSGQDCGRGTFSHRHARWVDQQTEAVHVPLNFMTANQAKLEIYNSSLSEEAVLGFEYGFSICRPNSLVIWEAQFGDFANGAQVMIDQFIASSEQKWLRLSGLVLLLPHGFEGMGPEHSSARLERFLQLCAQDNWQVVNCSTPANFFHALRRQMHSTTRKPLIVMTPKSLLRNRNAISQLVDFTQEKKFNPIIPSAIGPEKTRRVILCSGKVYYDLQQTLDEQAIGDVAIIRLEQYYPFPMEEMARILLPYADKDFIWCQEEPKNMGAWFFLEPMMEKLFSFMKIRKKIVYAGRPEAAAPATGNPLTHEKEQRSLIDQAFGIDL